MSEHTTSPPGPKVVEADPARPLAGPGVEPEDAARASGYKRRFALVYAALTAVAGAGIAAFLVLLFQPEAAPTPVWSLWKPSGSENAMVKQIADHVASRYRLSNGDQIAVALAGPPTVAAGSAEGQGNIPVRAIAVRPDTSTGKAEESDIEIVDASRSLQFVLCGLGQSCSIAAGQPSEARHALLRRQALELALYTFKYVDDVDTVTVFLPPRPDGAAPGNAVFLHRKDLQKELSRPLPKTLAPTAPGIGHIPLPELSVVNKLTRTHLYNYEYTQAQDGSAVLVLDPIVA